MTSFEEKHSSDLTVRLSKLRNAVRALAFAAAFVYPCYWLAQFAYGSLPSLLKLMLGGYELKMVRISVFGAYMLSGAAGDSPAVMTRGFRSFGSYSVAGVAIAVCLGALALLVTRRWGGHAGGLFVAVLGYVGCEGLLRRLLARAPDAAWVAAAAVFFALWTLGLRRWIAAASDAGAGYGRRFLAGVLGFTAPLAALWLVLHAAFGMSILRRMAWLFVPGLAPVALASLWLVRADGAARRRGIGWRWAAAAAGATAVLATALAWAGGRSSASFERRRAERAHSRVASLPAVAADAPYPRVFFQRGVSFTAEFPAPYASVDALDALARLPGYGVDSVALVSYGWARLGRPEVRLNTGPRTWESDEGIADVARLAHSLGMKVLLKPQLWVRGGSPTQVDFRDPAERKRWFAQYGEFIDHYARLAARIHADVFCVGVELARMSRYDAEWRQLIAAVRRLYPGPLVYAANFGPDFQNAGFWDALDYIGLDEYYPLPRDLSTGDLVRRVERVAAAYRRPVLFTEVGFTSTADPELRPWDGDGRRISLEDQKRCYEAIFRAFYGKPWFAGMYWWKVGTNGAGGAEDGSFTPWGKPAMEVVRRWYLHGARAGGGNGGKVRGRPPNRHGGQ